MRPLALLLFLVVLPASADEVDDLVDQLGARTYAARQAAEAELLKRGAAIVERLRRHAKDPDPEVAARVTRILSRIAADRASALDGVIRDHRKRNRAAYAAERETLRRTRTGQWVVYAGGKRVGLVASRRAAMALAPEAPHRLLFEIGVKSERLPSKRKGAERYAHGSLRHGDIGSALMAKIDMRLGVSFGRAAALVWRWEKGRRVLVKSQSLSLPGTKGRKIPIYVNTGFPGDLVVEPTVARALGLERYELPGTMEGATVTPLVRGGTPLDYPAVRAWVQLKIEGMKAPVWVVAVIPTDVRTRKK